MNFHFFFKMMLLLLTILLAACTPIAPGVLPTQVTFSQLPTETIEATITSTAIPESVNTPTPEPSVTAISTATPTTTALLQPNATTSPLVCSQVKSYINIQEETNNESWRLMDLVFEEEDELTFLMWSKRPYSGSVPTPLPAGVLPELSSPRRVLLKGQTWNFSSGYLVESPVIEQSAIQNPCDQNCPLEVVSIAPDNSWQLLQITDAPVDYQGFWLTNSETVTNLIPYIPAYSQWHWSNDSRMLWLIYTLQDVSGESYGSESMVVDLTAPSSPQIVFQSWNANQSQSPNLLSPDEYELVFSPEDKIVLSYELISFFEVNPLNNRLEAYQIDISQNPPRLLDTYEVHYPFLIDWSDTLQDFVILELNATGATLYTLNHNVAYEIPMEVIKQMTGLVSDGQARTDFSTDVDIMYLNTILKRVAISPDLQHIVLTDQSRAWSFFCSD